MKKVRVTRWIGLLAPVLLLAPSAFAEAAGDLKQAEGLYQASKYAEAEQIYQKILQTGSGNPEMAAQREVKPAEIDDLTMIGLQLS